MLLLVIDCPVVCIGLVTWKGSMMINVERYAGNQANVNSYLLSDSKSVIVVDLLRNSREAERLADHVEATGKQLETTFVTHGHPDHYLGLDVFYRRFPDVPISVASREVLDDIIRFSQWMESVGWLDGEPAMKTKSSQSPDGFDYAGIIQVLENPFLKLSYEPAKIEVQCDYPGSECGHMTTLCIPGQRAFLGFDLLYNRVHAWCGQGVGEVEINNWIQTLETISRHTIDDDWTFYCGHGAEGNRTLLDNMKQYLQTFLKVTAAAASREEAIGEMKRLFPGFAQEDFLLVQSVNFHVKESPASSTAQR
jgi:glyoxylase-like metal-dependent hydrolase (beta-lactamase superfamily II)